MIITKAVNGKFTLSVPGVYTDSYGRVPHTLNIPLTSRQLKQLSCEVNQALVAEDYRYDFVRPGDTVKATCLGNTYTGIVKEVQASLFTSPPIRILLHTHAKFDVWLFVEKDDIEPLNNHEEEAAP